MGKERTLHGGFTLIELLVVFTLLALLLTIAVPRYMLIAENSRAKAREQNLATIRDALDKFKADQGRFPSELGELVTKQYLRKIPIDPVTGSDAWKALQDPVQSNAGVYDIAPPTNASTVDPIANGDDSVLPLPPGKPNIAEISPARAP